MIIENAKNVGKGGVQYAKGNRDGKESVLVFVSDLYASITPSVKRLRAFDKQMVNAGETQAFEFVIDTDELAFVSSDNQWVTEPGDYTISIGGLTENITLQGFLFTFLEIHECNQHAFFVGIWKLHQGILANYLQRQH